MFYRIGEEITEIKSNEVDSRYVTAGYINSSELIKLGDRFGFAPSTVEDCQRVNQLFRTDVEVHDSYTFTELRIVTEQNGDDWIALYIKKNFLLVVDILDRDNSTKDGFMKAIKRCAHTQPKPEKILCAFIEALISGGTKLIETMRNQITQMEEIVINGSPDPKFNITLLDVKKKLQKLHNYYEQILDMTETLEDNDNDIFNEADLIYISNLSHKVTRLHDDVDSLSNSVDHLQDAYSASIDLKLNHQMKIFTVITSIFFPLTIIVGWYGMNFQSMPEFTWKYGYVYVILLSVAVVSSLTVLGKRSKWF